jgi:hypothetical protein
LYKIVPYKISADDEKIICSNFFLSSRKVTIYYKDITKLSGGIFSGRIRGLMKAEDSSKVIIGFFDKLKGIYDLQTLILSKVKTEVYNEVVESVGIRKKENNKT